MEGRIAKTLKTMALLEQPFIKDTDKTVATLIKEAVSTLGENIQVRRFERCACASTVRHALPVARQVFAMNHGMNHVKR